MQYNNPDGKWSESIPYMIINLEHERDIYLGKDTIMAYAREEDKSCDYLEINEIVQLANKDFLKSIMESDLVFSPAQITEHRCVELKDQEISNETKQRFEKLKGKYPKVFSVSSEDIGQTNLITMHVDMGDNPPKIFTTLDLRSGYYHITLDKESKAKTAFVMPFGKYEFNAEFLLA